MEDVEKSRTKQAYSSKVHKTQVKCNEKGEDKLCETYSKGSRKTQMQYQKSTCELQNERLKIYNIQALW